MCVPFSKFQKLEDLFDVLLDLVPHVHLPTPQVLLLMAESNVVLEVVRILLPELGEFFAIQESV